MFITSTYIQKGVYMTNIKGNQQTYTAEQVAEILGVSLRTVYNLCNYTKDFKVIRISKRCLRIQKSSFDQWFYGDDGIVN